MAARTLIAILVTLGALVSCSEGRDTATLRVAESIGISDTEINSAERLQRLPVAGRPNAGIHSYAVVTQIYAPTNDPDVVLAELRAAAEADGWTITTTTDSSWRTEERTIDGRTFSVFAAVNLADGQAALRLEEARRDTR